MEELKKLGLTGKEIAVYETLLKHGKSEAHILSDYSKVLPLIIKY